MPYRAYRAARVYSEHRNARPWSSPAHVSSRLFSQRPPSRERRLRGMYMCAYRSAHLKCVHSFQGASANSDVSIFHERRSVATRASVYSLEGKRKKRESRGKIKSPGRAAFIYIVLYLSSSRHESSRYLAAAAVAVIAMNMKNTRFAQDKGHINAFAVYLLLYNSTDSLTRRSASGAHTYTHHSPTQTRGQTMRIDDDERRVSLPCFRARVRRDGWRYRCW